MNDFAEAYRSEIPQAGDAGQNLSNNLTPADFRILSLNDAGSSQTAGDFLPAYRFDNNGSINFDAPGAGKFKDLCDSTTTGGSDTSTGSSTTPDAFVLGLQQTDPNLAQVMTDAQGQMSSQGYSQFEGIVNQDFSSGQYPTDSSLMQQAVQQFDQTGGTSSSDQSAVQSVVQNDLASDGNTPVSTYNAGTSSASGSGSDSSGGTSSAASSANPFSNLVSADQQLEQDIQNGASMQQIEQDLLGVLTALTTDISDIEAEIASGIAATGAGSDTGSSGSSDGSTFVPDPGAGPNSEASGGNSNPVDNYGPTTGTGSDTTGTTTATNTGSDTTGTTTATNTGSGSSATAAQDATSSVAEITANDGGGNEEIGTAFFVNSSGLMATDDHVVANSQGPIQVQLSNGQTVDANVVQQDQGNDLALLQVEGAGNQQFTPVQLGSPSSVSATDSAIGFPDAGPLQVDSGQYDGLATYGSFDVTGSPVASNPNRELEQFTNMQAQPGSSGSPIFNSSGQVVGIVDIGDGYGNTDATLSSALTSDIAQLQA